MGVCSLLICSFSLSDVLTFEWFHLNNLLIVAVSQKKLNSLSPEDRYCYTNPLGGQVIVS